MNASTDTFQIFGHDLRVGDTIVEDGVKLIPVHGVRFEDFDGEVEVTVTYGDDIRDWFKANGSDMFNVVR